MPPSKNLTAAADTVDELMHVDETEPELAIAVGPVIRHRGRFHWMPVITASDFPDDLPDGITHAEALYHNINTDASARIAQRGVQLEGWLMSGVTSVADIDPEEYTPGRLAEHPKAEHSRSAFYLDQDSGRLTFKLTTKTTIDEHRFDRPDGGWDIDEHGTVPALLDRFRVAASQERRRRS